MSTKDADTIMLDGNQLAWIIVDDEDSQVVGAVPRDLGRECMIRIYPDWYDAAGLALQIEDSEAWESTLQGGIWPA